MLRCLAFFLITVVFVASCSSPENKIIGTWKYDRIEFNPNNAALQQIQPLGLTFGMVYSGMKYEFHEDGTCLITYPIVMNIISTKYRVANGGHTLSIEDPTAATLPSKIVKITDEELWLAEDDNCALVFRKQ